MSMHARHMLSRALHRDGKTTEVVWEYVLDRADLEGEAATKRGG